MLLIFDNDGVLVDSEILAVRTEARLLAEVDMAMTEDEIGDAFIGLSNSSVFALLEERFGRPVPDGFEERIRTETAAEFETNLTEVAGISTVLDNSTLARCVASSGTPDRIAHSLSLTGLMTRFDADAIFSAVSVENGKPAPDLVLYAASQMGFEPAECIVIEDSPFGVQGALAAGMEVIAFTAGSHIRPSSLEKLAAAGAQNFASSASELEQLIHRLVGD